LTVDSADRRNTCKRFVNGNFRVLESDLSSAHEYAARGEAR